MSSILRSLRSGVCLLLAAGAALATAAEPAATFTFGPRPRLGKPSLASNETAAAIARADPLLAQPLYVPTEGAQWMFYYMCPKDAAQLRPESLTKHVCPNCGAVYTDARTIAAYRCVQQEELTRHIAELARAYAATGDEKYARPIRVALLELARVWPTLERHDRWGRTGLLAVVGGRRYAQLLDEAVSVITLSEAYDLVAAAPCFSAADRATIEPKFLGAVADELRTFGSFAGGKNNHQTWFNGALAMVGAVTGREDLLGAALDGKHGLRWQLDNSVTTDGIWYEGTIAYHFYALQAIIKTLDPLQAVGVDLAGNARLKSLWLGPARMTYPDGRFPVFHDSDPATLGGYATFYQWASRYFGDPLFALYGGLPVPANVQAPVLTSGALEGIGVVALRRGPGTNTPCAMIDYGEHGGHHGHPDKLNIVLFAHGHEYLLDPGRIDYSVPEYITWCRTTVAHNTVVVDQRDQQATTGSLWFFREDPAWTATLCATDRAYPGRLLKRFQVLTDDLLVDVLTVTGAAPATIDWMAHCRGKTVPGLALPARADPLGTTNGYQHLTALAQTQGVASASFGYDQDGRVLRIHLAGDADSTLVTGLGIGYHLKDPVPFLLRRRQAAATRFVTVYDLSADSGAVQRVELVPVTVDGQPLAATDGAGLRIVGTKGSVLVGLDLRQEAAGKTAVAGRPFTRVLVTKE